MTDPTKPADPTRPESGPAEEPTPPRFRERRSAFVEDGEETGAPPPADSPPSAAEPPAAQPPPTPRAEPVEPRRPAPDDEEMLANALADADAGSETGGATTEGPALDLDRLDQVEIPDASFHEIVEPLRLQALQFLGEVPLTEAGERAVLPRWAKHVIDLLGILDQRTRGNLSVEEREYMDAVLDDLRTRYLRAVG